MMKGKIGVSMQGIEIRKPKTFHGGKPVSCKDCKHLVFNIGNSKMPSSTSSKIKKSSKSQNSPYICDIKNTGLFYTSRVVCKHFEKK